ncbi:uncharacterized protein F4812DRAFT_333961 [Daldinia caldariorum]|uniref:uncharacterized protein n=1 Tax=Daldinia caldariorum TaxID=326644 RepID=UPI0020084AAA|nr:uncharacterized protein F4812DRAFT_333961 [Daldinia caldariorum]KAI1469536.1 hypothetical protein F4812DRAFT_333961 [Daldinia caldariorum]
MASADTLSAPGSATYASDTMVVGDGTWDFTKNTFLLPNLAGLNFETMRFNGMGNRFATVEQYHQLVTGHGVLAVITFLFIVPAAVMYARFRPYGSLIRLHAYLNILAVGLSTVVFVLGWFAVGPNRSLTNPHHGIGLAIYVMILVQIIGGRIVKNIRRKSFRLMLHRWLGRAIAILGIIQIPLGLTLYGSPLFTFVLYAVWMAFLLLVYFILSWRHESDRDRDDLTSYVGRSETGFTESERKSGRGTGWLGPLVAGAGIWALLRGRKHREMDEERSTSVSQPRSRPPEVIPSQRGSASYFEDEKISERTDRHERGVSNWLVALAGFFGARSLIKGARDKREKRRYNDEEYSAVATDTPSRFSRPSRVRKSATDGYTESEFSEDRTELHARPRPHTPLLPGPGHPPATTILSASTEPVTPRASHPRPPITESSYISDYSSYVSPSRRPIDDEESKAGGGILAAIGLGWLAKKMRGDGHTEEERRKMEDERRDGRHGSKYTGDGYNTPTKPGRRRVPPTAPTATTLTYETESSMLEDRPPGTSTIGPPMPPLGARGGAPPVPVPVSAPGSRSNSHPRSQPHSQPHSHSRSHSRSRSRSKSVITDPVSMPSMPPDPHGVLHPLHPGSGTESYSSAGNGTYRPDDSRRRREAEEAAMAAAASAAGLAAEEEERRRRDRSQVSSQPLGVKVKYHDDRDRNITLRRITQEEAAAENRHRSRSDSISTFSESEAPPSRQRYRRDSSSHRTAEEAGAEGLVSESMSPPTPVMAGRRGGKDSAYYSGQPGPSGGPLGAPTVSSLETPAPSRATWSAITPSPAGPADSIAPSAADRRRRRRQERRDQRPTDTVEFD